MAKNMFTYTMVLEDGKTFEYTIEGGLVFTDKQGDTPVHVVSMTFLKHYVEEETHEEVVAELVDGLNADALEQLDEADAA